MQASSFGSRLTRRRFLIAGGSAVLAACSSSNSSSSPGSTTPPSSAGTTVFVPSASSEPSTSAAVAPTGSVISILMPPNSIGNAVFERSATELGKSVVVEVYDDFQFVLDRLLAQQGEYQYDLIVVPGAFLPPAIESGLLLELDHSLIPGLADQLESVRESPFDPGSAYSVCKEVGYTGYAWDRTVIPDGIGSWEEFLTVAALPEVSGKVTALQEGAEVLATTYWSRGETTPEELDVAAAEAELAEALVPHLLDLDSGPSPRMLEGQVVLAQMWNGEGRNLVRADAERWGYAIGGPVTGVWMERFVVPAGAPDPQGAHEFIQLMLQPDIALAEVDDRGYNTGLATIQDRIDQLDHAEFVPTGDAMFDSTKDSGAAFTSETAEDLDAIVVGVITDLAGTSAPATTPPETTAPETTTPATTGAPASTAAPATTAVQYDDQGRRVLRPQDTGTEVETLQKRLVELGYSIGRVDGQYGDVTLAAVMSFQRSQGLQTDGVVGRYTWNALASPKPIVSRGTNTRGVSNNAPSDAATHAGGGGGGGGGGGRTWTKAIIYLDSFRDEFFDSSGALVATFPNSPGVNGLTPTGTFSVYSRSANTFYSKNPAETMQWMVRFNGGIGFHSVPRINGVPQPTPLGAGPSSHGCIRHADDVAKRIYDNLADGATVIVQHG